MAGKSKKTASKKSVAHKSATAKKRPAPRPKPATQLKRRPTTKSSPKKTSQPVIAQKLRPYLNLSPSQSKYLSIILAGCTVMLLALFLLLRPSQQTSQAHHTAKHNRRPTAMYPLFLKLGQVQRDINYCNNQLMDLYYPYQTKATSVPVVFYLHGGGWEINNKSSELDQLALLDGLRQQGIMIAAINYRKMPDSYFPAPVEDALCAVRYIRANSQTYGIDSRNIGLHGFSAGGYLAAMVATLDQKNPYNHGAHKEQSSRVQAVSTLAAVLDLEHHVSSTNIDRNTRFLRGAPANQASPINHISPDDPPFLMIHGAQDQFVSTAQDTSFAERLRAKGIKHDIILVAHAEHGLGGVNGEPQPSKAEISQKLIAFYRQKFGLDNKH